MQKAEFYNFNFSDILFNFYGEYFLLYCTILSIFRKLKIEFKHNTYIKYIFLKGLHIHLLSGLLIPYEGLKILIFHKIKKYDLPTN